MQRVYASLPLRGPAAAAARELRRGAELALERAGDASVELVVLDTAGRDRAGRAADAARQAAEDPGAVAYLGDLHSDQVPESAAILGPAGMLQVAPLATWAELGGPTLVRLMPHDGVLARGIADWLIEAGVSKLLVVHDYGDRYGEPFGAMCVEAARERGLDVRSRRVWDHDERAADDVGDAEAILYVGVAGPGAGDMWEELHALSPTAWLLGVEGVADPRLAAAIGSGAVERTRFFQAQRAPSSFYGFEAMALILDAIEEGAGDRQAIVRAARATGDRDSILGRYSIDENGLTTTTAYGVLAVEDGELISA